jgi:hypothetical protein
MNRNFTSINNLGIKYPNLPSYYDKEKIDNLLKAAKDPVFFAEKFVKIQHPTRGSIPLKLFDYQKKMLNTFNSYKYCIVLTARQMGKTTCACAYILWKAIFNEDQTILIAANKLSSALEIMQRIRYIYEECDEYIKPGVTVYNKTSIEFDNRSRIIARATTPDAGRGLSVSLLYCLDGNTKVYLRNRKTNQIMQKSLRELSLLLNNNEDPLDVPLPNNNNNDDD